ncbi:hypothetical protein Tco_0200310 [Tanacetum coccineum]
MIRVPVPIKILVITNLHFILRVSNNSSTVVRSVEVHIIILIVKQGTRPSMIRVLVTIKILMITILHFILQISNNSLTVVSTVEVPIVALIVKPGTSLDTNRILEELLRTLKPNSPVGEHEGSDDYTEVPFDDDKIPRQHYTAHVTPPPLAYRPSLPFLTTMEPAYVLLMRDEVISTTPARENDKLIKSSIDDLVPIPRESKVISDSNLECNKV